jgi:hypothetical protein
MAARQLHEIVGLQDHVVELDEGQLLLPVEAQADRVEGQHAVDREVPADVAQELDVVELRQPLGVVDHEGVRLTLAETEEPGEHGGDAGLVRLDVARGTGCAGSRPAPTDRRPAWWPPPIRTRGLCPVAWSQRSIMMGTSEPTWSEGAVQSKPI